MATRLTLPAGPAGKAPGHAGVTGEAAEGLHPPGPAGRYLVVRTQLSDRPGELIKLLSLVAEERGNLISVEHHREGMDIPVSETEVELTMITRDEEHCARLLDAMAERGYVVERLR